MTFCVRIEIKIKRKTNCPWIDSISIEESIWIQPGINGRRNHSWGRGDSDQLWLRINLCSALIGSLPELAFTDRSHWPALSTDLYHRSGTHFVSNSRGKHEDLQQKEMHRPCSIEQTVADNISLFLDLNLARQFWPRIWKVSSARPSCFYLGQL